MIAFVVVSCDETEGNNDEYREPRPKAVKVVGTRLDPPLSGISGIDGAISPDITPISDARDGAPFSNSFSEVALRSFLSA
jgi:hypothetical protein